MLMGCGFSRDGWVGLKKGLDFKCLRK